MLMDSDSSDGEIDWSAFKPAKASALAFVEAAPDTVEVPDLTDYQMVQETLVEAYRVLNMLPDHQARFLKRPRSSMPEIRRIKFDDQWKDDDPPPVRETPNARQITIMKSVLYWPHQHCRAHGRQRAAYVAAIVGVMSFARARQEESPWGFYKRRYQQTYAKSLGKVQRSSFYTLYREGTLDIVEGLKKSST